MALLSAVKKIGKPQMTNDLADLDLDARLLRMKCIKMSLRGLDMSLMLMLVQMQLHLKIG